MAVPTNTKEKLEKKMLRTHLLAQRDMFSPAKREKESTQVTEKILAHPWYRRAKTLLLFYSYGSEIVTIPLLEHAWHQEKQVFLPKIEQTRRECAMNFYQVNKDTPLLPGKKGILEPAGDTPLFSWNSSLAKETLMIMPGVGFDKEGHRLGYGGGFYDRFLSNKEELLTIAIGLSCQWTFHVPVTHLDVIPREIICGEEK